MTMNTSPITLREVVLNASPGAVLKAVGSLTAAASGLLGSGYFVVHTLQIGPLEKSRTELRADIAAMQIRLDKADEAYKALSVGMVDTRVKAAGLQVGFDGKAQAVQQCEVQLAQSRNSLAQYQQSYTMASHLKELRRQQTKLESAAQGHGPLLLDSTPSPLEKESYSRDIANLQKQIEAATKCF